MDHRRAAKRLLVFYFTLVAGSPPRGPLKLDNTAEIEDIVDHIIEAVKEELKAEAKNGRF